MKNIVTCVTFEKHEIFTNLFGESKLLFRIYRNIKINNTKLDKNEVIVFKDMINKNGDFNTISNKNFIDIIDGRRNNFNSYMVKGFREAEFTANQWVDRNLYKEKQNQIKGCKGVNKYIFPKKELASSVDINDDLTFNYFLENHRYNKFDSYDKLSFVVQDKKQYSNSIIQIDDGIFEIVKNLCCNKDHDYNQNEMLLFKYIFSKFSIDYFEDIKNLIIKIHQYCVKTKIYETNSSIDSFIFDKFLSSPLLNDFFFEILDSSSEPFCSSDISFSVPILFRGDDSQNDQNKLDFRNFKILNVFNFYGNMIPISGNKCIVISKSLPAIDNNLTKSAFHLTYFCNVLKEYYQWSKYNSESIINPLNNNVKTIMNTIFRYSKNHYTTDYVNEFKNIIFGEKQCSFYQNNKEHIAFFIEKFLSNPNISSNFIIEEIRFQEIISSIYGEEL